MTATTRKVRFKQPTYDSTLFNGKNSKDVAAWVDKRGGRATAAGFVVRLMDNNGEVLFNVRKGDRVVAMPAEQHPDGMIFFVFPQPMFDDLVETAPKPYTAADVKKHLISEVVAPQQAYDSTLGA